MTANTERDEAYGVVCDEVDDYVVRALLLQLKALHNLADERRQADDTLVATLLAAIRKAAL